MNARQNAEDFIGYVAGLVIASCAWIAFIKLGGTL